MPDQTSWLQQFYKDWIQPQTPDVIRQQQLDYWKEKYGNTPLPTPQPEMQASPWYKSSMGGAWRFTADDMQKHAALNKLMGSTGIDFNHPNVRALLAAAGLGNPEPNEAMIPNTMSYFPAINSMYGPQRGR